MNRLSATIILLLAALTAGAQTVINLNPVSDGKYMLDASLNGVGVRTYYTEESWFASVSSTTYLFLTENGYISDNDIKGMTVMKMPDGSTIKAGSFIIRNLKIGNVIVKDLPAFVIKNQNVPLIVGNSSFDCFGDVVLQDNKLLIYDGIERDSSTQLAQSLPAGNQTTSIQSADSTADSLRLAAQSSIDAKNYKEAVRCFEALKAETELAMYEEYQYILLLDALNRSDETIELGSRWIESYEGKTTYLDFGMLNAIGNAFGKKNSHQKAIEYYERSVSAYYKMFNMTEKSMMSSPREDQSLGDTLFNLARQYAATGSLLKSQHCYFVSAKCGNARAKEVCKEYNIKR